MLFLRDISLAFGGRQLFDRLNWTVRAGDRVGLVGPNGAGKSTLLRVIAGEQAADGGEVVRESQATVGYLRQDTQEQDTSASPLDEALHAFDDVKRLEAEEATLQAAMEAATDHSTGAYATLLDRFAAVHERLVALEAHTAESRAAQILSGLGFTDAEMRRPLATFSGGWRMRVVLARMLLGRPDVLLLDEPTNHLDIESIAWLEEYLKSYPGAVVLVSHDRYFLDRMTTRTAEVVRGQIDDYAGTYSFFLEARVERRIHWQAQYDNQQKSIAEAERFIERFRAKSTKASQAQSRIKMLEKLERVPPPPPEAGTIRFRFPDAPPSGRQVVELSTFSKRYPAPEPKVGASQGGTTAVFDDAGPLVLERGDKVALVGKNGAGKSTLARMLLGTEPFDGERRQDGRAAIAHFAQHQAEAIPGHLTVFNAVHEVSRGQNDTQLRSLLGAFLFSGDDVNKEVRVLSGGERSRLALARTLLSPANVLVLDEPTNHLDLVSKEVLAEALRQYSGTFVLVSHDRYFIDAVATSTWYVEDGTVRVYSGSYTEAQWQRERGTAAQSMGAAPRPAAAKPSPSPLPAASKPSAPKPAGGKKSKEEKRREAEARNAAYQAAQGKAPAAPASSSKAGGKAGGLDPKAAQRALAKVEAEIARAEAAKATVEAEMAAPDLYARPDEFAATMARFQQAEEVVKALYARWEALAAQAEAAG